MAATDVLTTLTVKKGASTASVSLKRRQDGSIEFTDANGATQRYHSNVGLKVLFDAINALV